MNGVVGGEAERDGQDHGGADAHSDVGQTHETQGCEDRQDGRHDAGEEQLCVPDGEPHDGQDQRERGDGREHHLEREAVHALLCQPPLADCRHVGVRHGFPCRGANPFGERQGPRCADVRHPHDDRGLVAGRGEQRVREPLYDRSGLALAGRDRAGQIGRAADAAGVGLPSRDRRLWRQVERRCHIAHLGHRADPVHQRGKLPLGADNRAGPWPDPQDRAEESRELMLVGELGDYRGMTSR